MTSLSIVIPTLNRPRMLTRVLDRLETQTCAEGAFEVIVVADAHNTDHRSVAAAVAGHRYRTRLLQGRKPGASAARNDGWRAAEEPVVLFIDDDILPEPVLVAEHLAWHASRPEVEVGVLGHVRWADELRVTPFMRWLEHGIQFDYPSIDGEEAGWGYFYTANVSVKRELIARVGGFDEESLPFGYEDLDLALRMHREANFRLVYNRRATAEHLHPMDLDFWRQRVGRIALAERQFCAKHPDFSPYFYKLFSAAAAAPPAQGRGQRLARVVPRSFPVLGERVWRSTDAVYRQALAGAFLEAWERAGPQDEILSSAGSPPGGPK